MNNGRICNWCKEFKSFEHFHKCKDGYATFCKPCVSNKKKERYNNQTKKCIVEKTARKRIELAIEVDKLKNHSCADCHIKYEPVCMDFDHRPDEEKVLCISKMIHENYSLDSIKKEIDKCDLVCVLCHRMRTHLREPPRDLLPIQKRNKSFVLKAQSNPCDICDIQYHSCQMDFDHLDQSTKRNSVCLMATIRYSLNAIQQEIDKCRLLCALCHRRHTAHQLGWGKKWRQ